MPKVIVYSKANCQQCNLTEMALKKQGVMYSVKKIDEDDNALQFVKSLGYNSAPVVYVDNDGKVSHWSQFRKGNIDELAAEARKVQRD